MKDDIVEERERVLGGPETTTLVIAGTKGLTQMGSI